MRLIGIGEARAIIGSLSFPTKMPATGYGLPAKACIIGAILAKVKGTVCSTCYALKDHYTMRNVEVAQQRRLEAISHPHWIDAMAGILNHTHRKPIAIDLGRKGAIAARAGGQRRRYEKPGYHRWHDSGDLQSVGHFASICAVACLTPKIKHWLPTQELGMVRSYLDAGGVIPKNLIVRVSSVMIDDQYKRNWDHTSSVFATKPPPGSHVCPAPTQENRCMSCRACWSTDVKHIAYHHH